MTDAGWYEDGITRSGDNDFSPKSIFGAPFDDVEHFLRDVLVLVRCVSRRVRNMSAMNMEASCALGVSDKGLVIKSHKTRID
jgi:hypothetical protein